MYARIFNVGHGSCAFLLTSNRETALLDCGYDETSGQHPADWLVSNGVPSIDHMVVSHFDQDHLSGLPVVRARLPIRTVAFNRTVPDIAVILEKLTSGGLTREVEEALTLRREYSVPAPASSGLVLRHFLNPYPIATNSNDLSLVTFAAADGLTLLFPGDIERSGWERLLANTEFCRALTQVNVFVASHHGRENGFHERVFQYAKPDVVVISDAAIEHDTQTAVDYSRFAEGAVFPDGSRRYVWSTRALGDIEINFVGNRYRIWAAGRRIGAY